MNYEIKILRKVPKMSADLLKDGKMGLQLVLVFVLIALFLNFLNLFKCMSVCPSCMYMNIMHAWNPSRSGLVIGSSGAGVRDGCEPLYKCKQKPGPL